MEYKGDDDMFFIDIKETAESYEVFYYLVKKDSHLTISDYMYKNSTINKGDVRVSNKIAHRLFHSLFIGRVYISNSDTVNLLNDIIGEKHMDILFSQPERYIICDKYLKWCEDNRKINTNIDAKLNTYNRRPGGEDISRTIQIHNHLKDFIDLYIDSFKPSKLIVEPKSFTSSKVIRKGANHYIIDLDSIGNLNFLENLNINSYDKVALLCKDDKSLSISDMKMIKFKLPNDNLLIDDCSAENDAKLYLYIINNTDKNDKIQIATKDENILNTLSYFKDKGVSHINLISVEENLKNNLNRLKELDGERFHFRDITEYDDQPDCSFIDFNDSFNFDDSIEFGPLDFNEDDLFKGFDLSSEEFQETDNSKSEQLELDIGKPIIDIELAIYDDDDDDI